MPLSLLHLPLRARTEQMLLAKIVTALGLALLLVVGAWSTSRGDADVHATLCLAPGASAPAAAAGAEHHDEGAAVDVLSSDAALCVIAVLCGVALVLLLRRVLARGRGVLAGRGTRTVPLVRAGPQRIPSALTLIELSISRT
ncbi:hypothetical protein KZC51_16645 [Microbacterium sp. SSW1-49]|uniref:Uncharacterized protein n=1 Tax=Microbacterium croceum TaxID=2851645 RepID=A0ABT0FIL8_9MICO|nr:hypothetical protein [Microbacterium croceum]MCK2037759.1 hypothetical protein [Microbacterium croceum]